MSDYRLLETLAVVDGEPRHLGLHLDRMTASARVLGFVADRDEIEVAARRAAREDAAGGLRRMRILLGRDGSLEVQVLDPGDVGGRLSARIATQAVRSDHPLIAHKTTERDHLTSLALLGTDDTLLVNERGELTEFVYGNVVLDLDDRLLTPAVRSGLLPGIERRRALESGRIAEAVLSAADARGARAVWHLNSFRGWTPVDLIDDAAGGGAEHTD